MIHEMTHQVECEGEGESQGVEKSLQPPCSDLLAHLNCILVVAFDVCTSINIELQSFGIGTNN